MPLDNYLVMTPHLARIFVKTAGGTYSTVATGATLPCHLEVQSGRAMLSQGIIATEVHASFKFPTSRYGDLKLGDRLLVDGHYWQVVSPITKHNAAGLIQFAETVVRRIDSE